MKVPNPLKKLDDLRKSVIPGVADMAYVGQKGLSAIKGVGDRISKAVSSTVDAVLDTQHAPSESGRIMLNQAFEIQESVRGISREALDIARDYRLIDKVNADYLPSLLDDPEEDLQFKRDIVNLLSTRFCASAPFDEELNFVAQRCFDRGVPIRRVVQFFENERLLESMVEGAMFLPYSRYRGTSVLAVGGSSVDSLIAKFGRVHENARRKPVDEETEEKLLLHMVAFEISYNKFYESSSKNRKSPKTMEEFVSTVEEKYPEYNVREWFLNQKQFFVNLLRGHAIQAWAKKDAKYGSRVDNIISDSYEERGKGNPETFIDNSISRFLAYEKSSEKNRHSNIRTDKDIFWLYPEDLKNFFAEIMPRIHSGDIGVVHTRRLIIDACKRLISKRGDDGANTLAVVDEEGKIEFRDYFSLDKLGERIESIVRESTKSLTSYIDVTNLLAEPEETPLGMMADYKDIINKKGEVNRRAYNKHLRNVFELIDDDDEEGITRVKGRIKEIFRDVENYIDSQYERLGIPNVLDFEDIRELEDYAKLLEIACTEPDPRRKFAARRKIELSWLIYSSKYSPRYSYRNNDRAKVKQRLEGTGVGINIDSDAPKETIKYIETADGQIQIIDDENRDENGEQVVLTGSTNAIDLIPATFDGIECYLLPATGSDASEKNYIDIKSLNSIVTKLMRKEKTRAKDITDILRLTFVLKNEADMERMIDTIEKNYVSFGRNIKRENRYGEFVRVQTVNLDTNDAKSDEYRTLRYVVDVPIISENGVIYMAPIEVRGLLPLDLAKERSETNDASHVNYELKRSREVMERLSPIEITPELYKEEGPHPHDIFEETSIKLKKESDFEQAA